MTEPRHNIMQQRKQLILYFVHLFREQNDGISPSIDQIKQGIGYGPKSRGSAGGLVNELIAEGWLKRKFPGSRTLVLTHSPDAQYEEITFAPLKPIERRLKKQIEQLKTPQPD